MSSWSLVGTAWASEASGQISHLGELMKAFPCCPEPRARPPVTAEKPPQASCATSLAQLCSLKATARSGLCVKCWISGGGNRGLSEMVYESLWRASWWDTGDWKMILSPVSTWSLVQPLRDGWARSGRSFFLGLATTWPHHTAWGSSGCGRCYGCLLSEKKKVIFWILRLGWTLWLFNTYVSSGNQHSLNTAMGLASGIPVWWPWVPSSGAWMQF